MNYFSITLLNRFTDDVAFLLESRAHLILQRLFENNDAQPMAAEHPDLTKLRERLKPKMRLEDGIAHIPIEGVIAYNPDPVEMAFYGVEDSRNIMKMIQDARLHKDVQGIQLNVDSPGGMTMGGMEIAEAVADTNKIKPVSAHIGGMGASLGYLIPSQAGDVTASRAAMVGSIGAYVMHTDLSRMAERWGIKVEVFKNKEGKYKAAGVPGTSLSDDQRANFQERAQVAFDDFKGMVLEARPGISAETMQGQVFTGKNALGLGLVDAVCGCDEATLRLKKRIKQY
jgi:signal peptide peptidase SppA